MNPQTKAYVIRLACFLSEQGTKMSAKELVEHLNRNELATGYGTPYDPEGRGIFKVLTPSFNTLTAEGRHDEATAVADSFTKEDGTYAYEPAPDRAAKVRASEGSSHSCAA
jgi:hypothetical protein